MTKEITLEAKVENIAAVTELVDGILEENSCPIKSQIQIDVAIDELLSNIAFYAYDSDGGDVTVRIEIAEDPKSVNITFIDSGQPYNPLEKEDPDVTLPAEERQIGGLGIFLVKKTMDDVIYTYEDGRNNLTIKKLI